jgi:hypothetical protein
LSKSAVAELENFLLIDAWLTFYFGALEAVMEELRVNCTQILGEVVRRPFVDCLIFIFINL